MEKLIFFQASFIMHGNKVSLESLLKKKSITNSITNFRLSLLCQVSGFAPDSVCLERRFCLQAGEHGVGTACLYQPGQALVSTRQL